MDVRLNGMLTAVSAHPPVFGAAIKTFDASAARAVKGVRDIVQTTAGLAVVADHFWAAKTARDLLKIEWTDPATIVDSRELLTSYAKLAAGRGKVAVAQGDPGAVLSTSSTLEAEVVFPYLAHAPMEPLNCTVSITPGRCVVWCGTQWPLLHQKRVAAMLGLSPEQVAFNTPHLGGSFGRRGSFYSEWIIEAVEIAKAVGRPVKFVWTREDDIRRGYYRPAYLHNVKIAIDADGYPTAWQHRVVGQSLFTGTPLEPDIVTGGIDWSSLGGVVGSPYLATIPHAVELHTTSTDVPVLPWRSVSHTHTAFVMETIIDELASRASVDPLEYRRKLLADHPRHLAALNLAAEKSGWTQPLPKGRFRGLAVHGAMGSYVAQVAEVSVDNGKIKVHRLVCAVDCGPIVNPDGIRAQMEGGIIYGLTAALYGEISITRGEVDQRNFHDYKMLRMNECPQISIHFVQGSGSMGGVGEPGVPPIAPAVANALFAATGQHFRSLPFKI
jgi:isoquinoline 1-oxidoreductase beta subunit